MEHKYGLVDISEMHANIPKVYVTDADNNPIEKAEVQIL